MYDGCYAHIISRSIERLDIFQRANDFEFFKKLLFRAKREYNFQIFHYCVMHTHFHVIPRHAGDGHVFDWTPNKYNNDEQIEEYRKCIEEALKKIS